MKNWKRVAPKAAFAAASYTYGSIPFVHLIASSKGLDLREVGSKNLGGANLWQSAGPAPGAAGWMLDASKGALPPLLARRLGLDETTAALGAVSGVVGQCWPLFLGLSGGRGVSAIVGASSVLAPREAPLFFGIMVAARLARFAPMLKEPGNINKQQLLSLQEKQTRMGPLSVGLAVCVLPLVVRLRGRPKEVVAATAANAAVLLTRRLTVNLKEIGESKNRRSILIYRLLYDRDTAV
jgi:hypothetical protein